ncbi:MULTISPECIES: VMAP-C domain-containing protein [Kitasatospora]|uniref:vWA-MoxR associated protein C-terminal domain-containing protein n=1 Tax=Kitasatospora cystarginea TaxID=58350 RepID=A0ABP5QHR9_9ACTN
MGWSEHEACAAEQVLLDSYASVLDVHTGEVCGGAVFLSGRSVLTCAHVVNMALRRKGFDPGHPGPVTLRISFRGGTVDGELASWIPPRTAEGERVPEGAFGWQGDLAVLRLVAAPPADVRPQRWGRMTGQQKVRAWYGNGLPMSYVDTRVQYTGPDVCYLDVEASGGPIIGPGYSGGPLWSPDDEAVVGLVVGQLRSTEGTVGRGFHDRSFAISWQRIAEELRNALGPQAAASLLPNDGVFGGDGPGPVDPLRRRLAMLIRQFLPGAEGPDGPARFVARECSRHVPPGWRPDADGFAHLLATEPRGLAALVEHLGARHPGAAEFLAVGRSTGLAALLSPGEYGWLRDALADTDPAVFVRAIGQAAPEIRLPPELLLPADEPATRNACRRDRAERLLDGLIAQLERHTGGNSVDRPGTPRVPPLLRAVEYHAAWADGAREPQHGAELRSWCGRVAARLGIGTDVLHEHRATAAEWAASRHVQARTGGTTAGPRIAVSLTRYEYPGQGGEGSFRCAAWADSGDRMLRPVPAPTPGPLAPDEVARFIRTVLATWDEDLPAVEPAAEDPLVEVFLDEPELGLPVEAWDSADPQDRYADTEPLGIAYRMVVRLAGELPPVQAKERARRLRRRWQHLDATAALHLDERCRERRHVTGAVQREQQAARVVLRTADRARRTAFAADCLRLGVPVVLWDRQSHTAYRAEDFEPLAPDGPALGLPERVRRYRAEVFADGSRPLRPVLAWEDPDRPPPPVLELGDPDDLYDNDLAQEGE